MVTDGCSRRSNDPALNVIRFGSVFDAKCQTNSGLRPIDVVHTSIKVKDQLFG